MKNYAWAFNGNGRIMTSSYPSCCDKLPDQSIKRKKGFILLTIPGYIVMEKSRQQGWEAAGYITSTAKNIERKNACMLCLAGFPHSRAVQDAPDQGMVTPTGG